MSDSIEIDGEVDAGWNSYYDPEEHGQMNDKGETVWASDDEQTEGKLTTEWWPSEIEADPEDLKEDQRKVIRYVVFNDVSQMNLREVNSDATPNRSATYANYVLKKYWPEKHAEIRDSQNHTKEDNGPQERVFNTVEELETVRKQLLSGKTSYDLSDEYGVGRHTIADYAAGRVAEDLREQCEIPPIVWSKTQQEYVSKNEPVSDETLENAKEEIKAQKDDIEELTESLAEATNTTPEEIEEGAKEIDIAPPENAKTVDKIRRVDALVETLEGMKRVATHEETKEALDYIQERLE